MSTTKSTEYIKSATEIRQEVLQNRFEQYIKTCKARKRHPCAALLGEFLEGKPYKIDDEIYEMKSSFTDILVFLTDPEIALEFKKLRSTISSDFATHLKKVLQLLDWADNNLCFAEIFCYELENYGFDDKQLDNFQEWLQAA